MGKRRKRSSWEEDKNIEQMELGQSILITDWVVDYQFGL